MRSIAMTSLSIRSVNVPLVTLLYTPVHSLSVHSFRGHNPDLSPHDGVLFGIGKLDESHAGAQSPLVSTAPQRRSRGPRGGNDAKYQVGRYARGKTDDEPHGDHCDRTRPETL